MTYQDYQPQMHTIKYYIVHHTANLTSRGYTHTLRGLSRLHREHKKIATVKY